MAFTMLMGVAALRDDLKSLPQEVSRSRCALRRPSIHHSTVQCGTKLRPLPCVAVAALYIGSTRHLPA